MLTKIRVIKNNKLDCLNLQNMKNALAFSKNDTNQYFLKLSSVVNNHTDTKIQSKAWSFLIKIGKLQNILNDLINRTHCLIAQWNLQISSNKLNLTNDIQKMNQLEKEIRIFNEIHFNVKRTYIQFTNKYFQKNWKKSLKVA